MNLQLNSLNIYNFKGIKELEIDFAGKTTEISGANGTGKTSVFDAFLWLLFGKDSTGRTDFAVRPLDESNQPIKGLDLTVSAEIKIDDIDHVLMKTQKEKVVKDQLRGYETLCWVDEVPKKVNEFNSFVDEIITADKFKMLADLNHFNANINWKDRREILLDIAGEIGEPEGFTELIEKLNGREIDEYRKVLLERKKRYTKERDEINPRIDEIYKGMEGYTQIDMNKPAAERAKLVLEIADVDKQRKVLVSGESKRQKILEELNGLKAKRAKREMELQTDTGRIQKFIDEKNKLIKVLNDRQLAYDSCRVSINRKNVELQETKEALKQQQIELNKIREDFKKASKEINTKCPTCEQDLPQEKIQENLNFITDKIAEQGDIVKGRVEHQQEMIDDITKEMEVIRDQFNKAEIELKEVEEYKVKRMPELDEMINNQQTVKIY